MTLSCRKKKYFDGDDLSFKILLDKLVIKIILIMPVKYHKNT